MAGGALAKIDPAGVHLMGASIRLNSGGAPGVGGGVKAQAADMPKVVAKNGGAVEPPVLAEVGTRQNGEAKPVVVQRLKQAKRERAALVEQCQEKPDGTCPLNDCPCGKSQPA